jgi:DNA-3-methyladenine glycosylase I
MKLYVLPNHKFCASCGAKQDFTFLDIGRDQAQELHLRTIDFAATVTAKLPAIKKHLSDYKCVKEYGEEDVKRIMSEKGIICNEKKIRACIKNAQKFDDIVKRYGSFGGYVESFGDLNKESTLNTLKEELMKFEFLGIRTAYHFMLDMGLNVWKPDRVICRILYRLGLIDTKEDIEKTVRVGREISNKVGLPIRYVDIVFVKYGQEGAEEPFGLDNGICLSNNPRCHLCGIREFCIRHTGS